MFINKQNIFYILLVSQVSQKVAKLLRIRSVTSESAGCLAQSSRTLHVALAAFKVAHGDVYHGRQHFHDDERTRLEVLGRRVACEELF